MEGLIFAVWKDVAGIDLSRSTRADASRACRFDESMRKYGNDKPDLRFDMPHTDLTDLVIEHDGGGIPFFKDIAEKFTSGEYRRDLPAEIVKAMVVPAEPRPTSRAPTATSSRSS